jgi:hypothetical protein
MRQKKRYVLLKEYPRDVPENSKFLFQNSSGYVFKTDLKGAKTLRKYAILISGSVWKVKDHPKVLYSRKTRKGNGMK